MSLSRRALLRGATGALALPLLPSLRARAQEGVFPKRIVFMYAPNGVPPESWWPTAGATPRDFTLNVAHRSLEPFKDRLSIIGGLDMAATGPGGPHARGVGTALTGQELQLGDMPSNDGRLAGWANGISLDQHIASVLQPQTPAATLQVGVRADNHRATNMSRLCYAGPAQPLSPISDPSFLWRQLFPGATTRPGEEARQLLALDTVRAQFAALRGRVGTEDRERLAAHEEMVTDLQSKLADVGDGVNPSCEAPSQPVVADVNGDLNPDFDHDMTMRRVAEIMVDMLALALTCDLTRIATMQFANAWARVTYPWLGRVSTNHDLSHAGNNDRPSQEAWTSAATFHGDLLARLMQALSAAPEGDGTVLDNTIILWFSEIAIGNVHTHTNMPYIVAGDGGGALQQGQYLRFSGRYHNDLLVTLMNAMGVEGERFGRPELCQGPLPGLLA